MTHLARTLVLTALALGLGATGAFAQQATPVSANQAATQTAAAQAATGSDTAVIKPGDRDCIRNTGSRIRAKGDHCLPVVGRSYSGQELRNTGQVDTARALQMLDPSTRIGQ